MLIVQLENAPGRCDHSARCVAVRIKPMARSDLLKLAKVE